MKTVTVDIAGKSYPLCLSTRVMVEIENRGKENNRTLIEELDSIMSEFTVSGAFWLLSEMMNAAYSQNQMDGKTDIEAPPTYDEMLDKVFPCEYEHIFRSLREAVDAGMETTIQAEAPKGKNAKPTRGN